MDISIKNTKAEIMAAFDLLQKENATLKAMSGTPAGQASAGLVSTNLYMDGSMQINSVVDKNVTVVIPYVGDFAQGNELILALRSWAENFREKFNVVVIGNGLPKLSEHVHVIECDPVSDNPPLDIAHKMMLTIESEKVSEKFIWANDDQYLVSPCLLADFETLKSAGYLDETKFGSSLYQQNKKRTLELLQNLVLPLWDYSTHMPFVFEKEKLKEVIINFNMLEQAYLIASVYFNFHFQEFVPYMSETQVALMNDNLKIGVYRKGANLELLQELMSGKKLVSNSETGWSPELSRILNERFTEKCLFEE